MIHDFKIRVSVGHWLYIGCNIDRVRSTADTKQGERLRHSCFNSNSLDSCLPNISCSLCNSSPFISLSFRVNLNSCLFSTVPISLTKYGEFRNAFFRCSGYFRLLGLANRRRQRLVDRFRNIGVIYIWDFLCCTGVSMPSGFRLRE